MAPTVRQSLSVYAEMPGAGDSRWVRDVEMDFLPLKGDKIDLWSPGVAAPSVPVYESWPVFERRFSADGAATIKLVIMLIAPDEDELRTHRALRDGSGQACWADQADVETALGWGGWEKR